MKNKSKKLEIIKRMPKLFHTLPNQSFDILKSQVIGWLIQQPDVLNYLWDHVKQSGFVEYEPVTKTWKGVDS